ncbi:MAG: formamidopyrimidine-DNA glycosylase [Azospira oryzae]|nr:MAG: formamidopyrimidine-DNA glycosylase [Azospira oryzae]
MPELPEVENFRSFVDRTSLHQKIEGVKLAKTDRLFDISAKDLIHILEGNEFESTWRHGKFLFIRLKQKGHLVLHFGMTGELYYHTPNEKSPKVYVLLIHFENGKNFIFSDSRGFGMMAWTQNIEGFIKKRGYGDDALQIDQDRFLGLFRKRKVAIKTALMNQHLLAGVGNEFSDAILFQTKIHPLSVSGKLSIDHLKAIFLVMKKILKEAVSYNADRNKLNHYFLLNQRKAGLVCPRCKGKTEFQTIGGRSSYFCPSCQERYP